MFSLTNVKVKKSNVIKSTVKCRCANSNKKIKTIVTISDFDDNCDDNNNKENLNLNFNELEYQERELVLKKCELLLREREAKVHVMELSNFEKEQKLKLHVTSIVNTMKVIKYEDVDKAIHCENIFNIFGNEFVLSEILQEKNPQFKVVEGSENKKELRKKCEVMEVIFELLRMLRQGYKKE
ncbi:kinase-like domain-containing protein [Rhizophagus irregularis DAOM 181602=DAOM 197198]|uniref:Uncharacterized protein n=1 Tax=Rhizophagus irregularis (strain DAOM 181602 / DAOM 197198 / MUCL 43194) TaxID=747089 RepID=A0A2P4QBI5_RHIID|nr:hypothetical protein GLOIN_2v1770602 [Rhizophagus irregularis DAOM 181602=DAOM 197198]POG75001.1 hypothetical protein GLOIN_2v1770602 [Rhizophagus irregularis DAOM 181602=DAOM 197198]GET51149.1 kinase-like domain-containing protein [Rhizophagus irregularis DAOM 181602=DAOM 197198]|eukprot:XP_025181867.1 hypothetical protein GLOIN_2v1770602 [Rhizophagus irregularis DAOM 181602=DAOM 197198]